MEGIEADLVAAGPGYGWRYKGRCSRGCIGRRRSAAGERRCTHPRSDGRKPAQHVPVLVEDLEDCRERSEKEQRRIAKSYRSLLSCGCWTRLGCRSPGKYGESGGLIVGARPRTLKAGKRSRRSALRGPPSAMFCCRTGGRFGR